MAKILIPIGDGFDLTATVGGSASHPPLTVKYRPAGPERAYQFFDETEKGRYAASAKLITEFVLGWDAEDNAGVATPVTIQTVARIPHFYIVKLCDLILGYGGAEAQADEKKS